MKPVRRAALLNAMRNALRRRTEDARNNAGMNDYVSKPIDRRELLATIGKWVAIEKLPLDENSRTATGGPVDATTVDSFKEPQMSSAIDVEDALERVGGNESLLIKVMSIFHETYGNIVPEIRAALEKGDMQEACRKAHTLKGVAGSLSARAVFETARELESTMRNGVESGREELLSELDARVAAATAFAREVDRSKSLHPPATAPSDSGPQSVPESPPAFAPCEDDGRSRPGRAMRGYSTPPLDRDHLGRLLSDLVNYIREHDPIGSENALAAVSSALSAKGHESLLEIIAGRLNDYDFEGAIPEVEELARAVGIPRTP